MTYRPALICLFAFATFLASTTRIHAAPIEVADLASSSAWTVSVDGGGSQTVTVPGNTRMSDNAVFRRSITIPASAANNVVKVLFGGVNYGCDVYLGTTLIASHKNLMLPFEADLTGKVTAGSSYTLEVRAYSSAHYANKIPQGCYWASLAYGITRYVKLAVYPQVYVKDVYIRPSVKADRLDIDIWVHNASAQSKTLTAGVSLASWNNDPWVYPAIAPAGATIPANTVSKISMSTRWGLGPQSYWWPNIPFKEAYAARLHNLLLSVKEGATTLDTVIQRFGFVEHAEGPYYYMVNGVRIGCQPSDGTPEAQYGADAYSNASCFSTSAGCKESWKRYMRLGVTTNRTHSSIPTENLMNSADEAGFMLVPESGIRGFEQSGVWDSATYTDDVREMALTCRDHPSIVRYSIDNEFNYGDYGTSERMLADAAWEVDSTRPLVIESNGQPGRVNGLRGHAYYMCHYAPYRTWPVRVVLAGMGEYAYDIGGRITDPAYAGNGDLMREADLGKEMRKRDVSYFAIWDFYVYWRNFLSEGSTSLAADKVTFMKRALDPYLAADSAIDDLNLPYTANWPTTIPSYTAGSSIKRTVWVFNGGLSGNRMGLFWDARWDSPAGAVAAAGAIDTMTIEPGFYSRRPVTFNAPATGATADTVSVQNGGSVVFKDDRVYFNVGTRKLYFIMKSVLYPPVKRFGLNADSITVGGADPATRTVSVAWADAGLPVLAVSGKPAWITTQVSGQGAAQTIGVAFAAGTLTSGIYRGMVTVTAAGFLADSFLVMATVDGAARAARLTIVPSRGAALAGGTAKFAVQAFDQFNKPIAATIDWSAASGGTMDAAGAFTSNGTAGVFQISATVHGDTAVHSHALVEVAAGKPVPTGWLTELLALTDPSNSPYILFPTMAEQIESMFTNPDNPPPCNKQTLPTVSPITGNPYVLTWNAMTDTSGTWVEAGKDYFIAYWAVTLLNPTSRKIKLVTRHDEALSVWLNGAKIIDAPGIAATDATSAAFALDAGANNFVFRLMERSGPNVFAARITDEAGAAVPDLRYLLESCGQTPVAVPFAGEPKSSAARAPGLQIHHNRLAISISGSSYAVCVMTPRGTILRTCRGIGPAAREYDLSGLGAGMYIVSAEIGKQRFIKTIIISHAR